MIAHQVSFPVCLATVTYKIYFYQAIFRFRWISGSKKKLIIIIKLNDLTTLLCCLPNLMSIYSILSLLETRDEGGNDEDFTITYAKLMVVRVVIWKFQVQHQLSKFQHCMPDFWGHKLSTIEGVFTVIFKCVFFLSDNEWWVSHTGKFLYLVQPET